MAETPNRIHAQLGTGAITDAGSVLATFTAPKTTVQLLINHVEGTTACNIDLALDVGGSGATLRRVVPKDYLLEPKNGITHVTFIALAGDKLRGRASAPTSVDVYGNTVEST